MPAASVVIPTFNNGRYIRQAIDSVLNQSIADIEVIVVDDGSTDDTKEQLACYGQSINYICQTNSGAPVARNTGIEAASGKYIAFLDSDDIWEPDNLEVKIGVLDTPDGVDLVFSDFSLFDARGIRSSRAMRELYPIFSRRGRTVTDIFDTCRQQARPDQGSISIHAGDIFQALLHGNFIILSSVVARKSALDQTGYFNPDLITQQDYEYFLRLARGHKFAYIDEPLVRYRRHSTQLTARKHTIRIISTVAKVLRPYYEQRHSMLGGTASTDFEHRFADVFVELGLAQLGARQPLGARESFRESLRLAPVKTRRMVCWLFSLFPPMLTHDAVNLLRRSRK